jgi:hypothetical protein
MPEAGDQQIGEHQTVTPTAPGDSEQPKEAKAGSWFPIRADMTERPEFSRLSPCAAVVLLDLIRALNSHSYRVKIGVEHGPFWHYDRTWAKRLRMSINTFRAARSKLSKLGWLVYTPGYQVPDGKPQPSSYHDAEFAHAIPRTDCGTFYHSLWRELVGHLQRGHLQHLDLVTLAVLRYFWHVGGGDNLGLVTVPKRVFIAAAGITMAALRRAVARIRSAAPGLVEIRLRRTSIEIVTSFERVASGKSC